MHIVINPKYASLHDFIARIPSRFDHEGHEIYRARNVIKVMRAPDGTLVNVKRYHVPHGPNRLIYSWNLRKPKCRRAYEYPFKLLARGIETPEPIAVMEERGTLHLLGYSYFVSVQCPYEHTLYEVGNAPEGSYEALAEALATFSADMHLKGVMHKDYTPGNVLWTRDEAGYHFALVDINRMHFGPVSLRQGLYNMRRFWGPRRFSELLAARYATLRHTDPAQAVAYMLRERARFWAHFARKHPVPFDL